MKGDEYLKADLTLASNKRKGFFIAFALLALLLIFILVDSSLYQQNQTSDNPANLVSFLCHSSSSNQTFTINVDVDLTDNMDQDEAIKVAFKVLEQSRGLRATSSASAYFSWAAHMNDDGTWVVKFYLFSSVTKSYCARRMTYIYSEKFVVVINPSSRTVVYESA